MPNIYFGLPLISQRVSKDWGAVVLLLNATLDSIFDQTDPRFEVLIVGHERPATGRDTDPRLHFHPVSAPVPVTVAEQVLDKRNKIRAMVEEVCRRGGGYLVLMDADDLVARRLVEFVHHSDNRRGYIIEHGYILEPTRRRVFQVNRFFRHSGSCAIFYLSETDLTDEPVLLEDIAMNGHMYYDQMAERHHRPLDPVPFPAMIYVRHHGQNLCVRGRSRWHMTGLKALFHQLAAALLPAPKLPAELVHGFRIPAAFARKFRRPETVPDVRAAGGATGEGGREIS